MKFGSNKNIRLAFLVAGIFIAAIAFCIIANLCFGSINLDTSDNKRYSLSYETIGFLKANKKNIAIRLYKDKDLGQKSVALERYAGYVRKLLEKYRDNSLGKIDLTIIETIPFTSTQVEAEKSGIKEFELANKEKYVYLGAVFTSEDGKSITIPRLKFERAGQFESDVTQILSVLAADKKPVLGVISSFFRVAEKNNLWEYAANDAFINQLKAREYEVIPLSTGASYIPQNVDAVLVFYPLNLSKITLYALDQYLMRGGRVIVMLDASYDRKFAEDDIYKTYYSGLDKFLQNNGVVYFENTVVGNIKNAFEVLLDGEKIKYAPRMIVDGQSGNEPLINRGLKNLYFSNASYFKYDADNDNINAKVLLETEDGSGEMSADFFANPSYNNFVKMYDTTNKQYPLAILLEGRFKSMFERPLFENTNIGTPPFLSVSVRPGKLLLIGDCDWMNAKLWDNKADEQHGIYDSTYISDNIIFLLRIVDYMTESGYITLASRKNNINISLSEALYHKVVASYQKRKSEIESNLVKIKREKAVLEDKMRRENMPTVKQFKTMEELQRAEIEQIINLQQIDYLIGEKYSNYRSYFNFSVILVVPICLMLIVGIIYAVYEQKTKRKAREYIE